MCRSFSTAFLLALCFVSSPLVAGGWLLDQSSKESILATLNELEANSQTLKANLQTAIENSDRLEDNLTTALSNLATSENNLREARQRLADSEANLAEVSALLTKTSEDLKRSEASFKAYQQSEALRIGAWSGGALIVGLIIGFLAHH